MTNRGWVLATEALVSSFGAGKAYAGDAAQRGTSRYFSIQAYYSSIYCMYLVKRKLLVKTMGNYCTKKNKHLGMTYSIYLNSYKADWIETKIE